MPDKSNTKILLALVLCLFIAACGVVDTIIGSLDAAPAIVAVQDIPLADKDRLTKGFNEQATVMRAYKRADKSTPELKKEATIRAVASTTEILNTHFVDTNNPKVDAWVSAIVRMVRSFLNISDEDRGVKRGGYFEVLESIEISDAEAKEFERLVKRGPK